MKLWRIPDYDEDPPDAMVEWLNLEEFNGQWEGDDSGIVLLSDTGDAYDADLGAPGDYIMDVTDKLRIIHAHEIIRLFAIGSGTCAEVRLSPETATIFIKLENPK